MLSQTMFLLFAAAAISTDPLTICAAAVHGQLATAVEACAQAKADLWSNVGPPTPACDAAMRAGVQAGNSAALPRGERNGAVSNFDHKVKTCRATILQLGGPKI